MNKIAVGVVLFNPDERAEQCLEKLAEETNRLYIFDNSTEKINIHIPKGSIYLCENQNKGVSYALNKIVEKAKDDGYTWILTMDQDTIIPKGMIDDFEKYTQDDQIGIICPQVIDKRRKYMKIEHTDGTEFVHKCITSGSCVSINLWEKIGKFDEWLFIDLVDNEFCKRVVSSGKKILRVNKWVLDQEFGKITLKSEKIQKFWIRVSKIMRNHNFGKFSYKKMVSPLRVYYTCRNIIYVNKKLKLYGKLGYESYNCKGYTGFLISFILPSILRSDCKIKVLKFAIKGTIDGLKKKVDVWHRPN